MGTILIRDANVVFPDEIVRTSVLIDGTQIADIDVAISTEADEVIDANGLHLLPGVIDDQVHFREPGLTVKEDLAHATRACAKGGVTTFFDMPNTIPTTTTLEQLDEKLTLGAQHSLVNYAFFVGATGTNLDQLRRAERTPGIKIFLGSSTGELLVDDQSALERIFAETTLPIAAHCEDETTIRANAAAIGDVDDVSVHSKIRDTRAAVIATMRAIDLAVSYKHRFHVLHVSTAAEVGLIAATRGLVTAEACPHHLLLSTEDYPRLGNLAKVNPSLKSPGDCERLWQGLLSGELQVIATDHAPHTLAEKRLPYPQCPAGMPSIENSLALMLNEVNAGRCTLQHIVRWMSLHPALVWDVVNKGRIERGYDADLVLVNLELTQTIRNENQQTKCRWSPWHGETLRGWPVRTWVMGREVFRLNADGTEHFADEPAGQEVEFEHSRGGFWAAQELVQQ